MTAHDHAHAHQAAHCSTGMPPLDAHSATPRCGAVTKLPVPKQRVRSTIGKAFASQALDPCRAGARQHDGLDGGHERADERGGALLHRQAHAAVVAVGLPPRAQPLLLQRLRPCMAQWVHSTDVANFALCLHQVDPVHC